MATENYSIGLQYEVNEEGSYCTVTGIGTCTDTEIVIPDTYEGYAVREIGQRAFASTNLTSITIPDTVTSISSSAFSGCNSLMSVTIPNSVTSMGAGAFFSCHSLTSVTIGNGVTSIDNTTFQLCNSLTSITIGNNVTSIGKWAFYGCDSLTSIIIPDSVTSMDDETFRNCDRLTSVTIGSGVRSIGSSAFEGCYSLVEVIDKSSLGITKGSSDNGYVAYYALEVHSGESKIVNNNGYLFYTYDGVNYLVKYAGRDTQLTLPANYNDENYKIHNYAFYNCDSLTSVRIGNNVTSIGSSAFLGCTQLQRITLNHPVNSLEGAVWGAPEDVQVAWIGATGSENVEFYFLNDPYTPCPAQGAISFGVQHITDSDDNVVSTGDDGILYVTNATGPHAVGTFDADKIRFKDALAFTENFGKYKPNGVRTTYDETKGMSVQEFITSALTNYSIKSYPKLTASISPVSARYGTTQGYNLTLTFTQGQYSDGKISKCVVENISIKKGSDPSVSYEEYVDELNLTGSTTIPLASVELLDDLPYECVVGYTADTTKGVGGVCIPNSIAEDRTTISCYSGCLIYTTTEDLASDTATIVQTVTTGAQLKSKSDNPPESYKISNSWKHLCVLVPTATSSAANWNPLDTDGNSPLPQTVREEGVQVLGGDGYNNSSKQISYTLFISSNASSYNSCTVKFNWSR